MHCPACGSEQAEPNRFCGDCGSPLVAVCPACGTQAFLARGECGSCGQALAVPRRAPRGERRLVTVLFADIVESTRLVADLDPEDAMDRLLPAVAAMAMNVRRFQGRVVRTMGDGLLAIFGAPLVHEGHALLACRAALAMQERAPAGEPALTLRIGIHSGEIIAGGVDEFTNNPAIHGGAIHLASRLEQMAEPGGIYMTEDTLRLVRPYCEARPLGRQPVRGFSQLIGIYRLLGLKPVPSNWQFQRRLLPKLRGRERVWHSDRGAGAGAGR